MSENSESDDNEMQVFMFLVYMCTIGKSRDYIASATFGFFFLNVCETQFISMLYTAWEIESWYKCCLEIDEIEIKSIKDTITFMGMGVYCETSKCSKNILEWDAKLINLNLGHGITISVFHYKNLRSCSDIYYSERNSCTVNFRVLK